jgi:hypothetical protein
MPRRSPGALRAQTRLVRGRARTFSQVRGLRRDAQAAVWRLEARRFWPGYVSEALIQYESFLRQPGRWLYVPLADCPCHDVVGGRDNLQAMLDALPPGRVVTWAGSYSGSTFQSSAATRRARVPVRRSTRMIS